MRCAHPAQQIVFQDNVDAVTDTEARVDRLTPQIPDLLPSWSLAPVVSEVGGVHRFDTPPHLMAYLGLTPSECSSGTIVRRGGITKAGSGFARRAL